MPGHVLLCKRFRENGKLLEFCGRSNKAGLFVVIAVYFGGSRRGCIMIPASSNRAGWSLFQNELRNFCSGAKPVSPAKISVFNGGGGGQLARDGQSGKSVSVFGNQQKFRNFEKNGTKWGQNVNHGVSFENGSARNGNVSALSGRPMRACNFKLTPALLALRVCKLVGGRRIVTLLSAKEISSPKDVGAGPEVTKLKGGLVVAQPVVQMPSITKHRLVKPSSLQVLSAAQTSWVIGESSSGVRCGDFELSESATASELVLSASALNGDPTHRASVASPAGRLEGATPDVAVSVTVAPEYKLVLDGCMPMVVSSAPRTEGASPSAILERAIPDVEFSATVASVSKLELDACTPMEDSGAPGPDMVVSDVGNVGSSPASTTMVSPALQNGSQAHRRHQWVKQNRFSPCLSWVMIWVLSLGKGKIEMSLWHSRGQ